MSSSASDRLPFSPPASIRQYRVFMPTRHERRDSHLWCSRVSAHLGMVSGRASWPDSGGTAMSGYESMLNSDSSSSASQIIRFSYPAVWQERQFCSLQTVTVKEQLMKPISEIRTSQGLPMSKSTISCRELRREIHSQWPETSSRR